MEVRRISQRPRHLRFGTQLDKAAIRGIVIYAGQAFRLIGIEKKPRIIHAQWQENSLLEELGKRQTGHHFNQAAEHIRVEPV